MNLFLGVVIGVLLTIGTAFVADAFTTAEVTSENMLEANRELGCRKGTTAPIHRLNSDGVGSPQKRCPQSRVA
jgi:hypothetical protein